MNAKEALDCMKNMGNHLQNKQGKSVYRYDKDLTVVIEMGNGENEMWAMSPDRFLIECKDEEFEFSPDGIKTQNETFFGENIKEAYKTVKTFFSKS